MRAERTKRGLHVGACSQAGETSSLTESQTGIREFRNCLFWFSYSNFVDFFLCSPVFVFSVDFFSIFVYVHMLALNISKLLLFLWHSEISRIRS